jgi:hypothetical protein
MTQPLNYYNRSKDLWDNIELNKLQVEYINNNMNVIEIADLHKRTPGSIAYRLKKLGLVTNHMETNGYDTYRNSDLYKEIVNTGANKPFEKKTVKVKRKINEIQQIQRDLMILKNGLAEVLRLMHAIYEFENS